MKIADIQPARHNLEQCVAAIKDWCSSRRLQLNEDKTELIWFGSRANLKRLSQLDTTLQLGPTTIQPTTQVRNLGVYMDSELNMRGHIGKVASACFFHLRRLRQLRYVLTPTTMQRLISAFILSKLDYCNSVLAGLPAATLSPLQRVMNAVVRLVVNLGFRDPVSASMKELHWLPITYRIKYKLCIMMYSAVHGNCPAYITEILVPTSTLLNRARLRSSSSGTYDVPRVRTQFGKRAFSIAGPTAWNELPVAVRNTDTIASFKRNLKAHFFSIAYS